MNCRGVSDTATVPATPIHIGPGGHPAVFLAQFTADVQAQPNEPQEDQLVVVTLLQTTPASTAKPAAKP